MTETYTHKQMMDEPCLDLETGHYCGWLGQERHEKFYSQFVSERITAMVVSGIGAETLAASRDAHLNDIPLERWDRLPRMLNEKHVRELGGNMSLSTFTCVHKQAARMWLAKNHPEVLRFKASCTYPTMKGDNPCHRIHSFAIGLDEACALMNFRALNRGPVDHRIHGPA